MALMGAETEIDDFLIISGYVVSAPESGNTGENPKTTYTSIDYSMCNKTVYLESLDGKYGFLLETATEEDNIFDRYDKVQLLLNGTKLTGYEIPTAIPFRELRPRWSWPVKRARRRLFP